MASLTRHCPYSSVSARQTMAVAKDPAPPPRERDFLPRAYIARHQLTQPSKNSTATRTPLTIPSSTLLAHGGRLSSPRPRCRSMRCHLRCGKHDLPPPPFPRPPFCSTVLASSAYRLPRRRPCRKVLRLRAPAFCFPVVTAALSGVPLCLLTFPSYECATVLGARSVSLRVCGWESWRPERLPPVRFCPRRPRQRRLVHAKTSFLLRMRPLALPKLLGLMGRPPSPPPSLVMPAMHPHAPLAKDHATEEGHHQMFQVLIQLVVLGAADPGRAHGGANAFNKWCCRCGVPDSARNLGAGSF